MGVLESTKGGMNMSEKEKKIVKKLKEALSKMSDYQKGYMLGMVESLADNKPNKDKEETKEINES